MVYLMKKFYGNIVKNPLLIKKAGFVVLVLIIWQFIRHLYKIIEYERYLSKMQTIEPDSITTNIAQSYFDSLFWMILLSVLLGRKCFNIMIYMSFLSILLWFSNAYFRIIIFAGIFPIYEFIFLRIKEAFPLDNKNLKRIVTNLFLFQALTLYFTFYGTTISNVNIRAANRAHNIQMGEFFIESGIIFAVTKYCIQVLCILYTYCIFFPREQSVSAEETIFSRETFGRLVHHHRNMNIHYWGFFI